MSCTTELGSTLQQLRAGLLGVFGSLLGTYTLPDGTTVPAIRMEKVPPDWRVSGTELAIERSPERVLLAAQFRCITNRRVWTLKFTAFGGGSLDAVRLMAFRAFPHAVNRLLPETDNTFGQLTIELPEPTLTTLL
jgi:hypothetical protein